MTYLELTQELARMTATAQSAGDLDPLDEVGTYQAENLKRWIRQAWVSLQNQSDWLFMIQPVTITLSAGQGEVSLQDEIRSQGLPAMERMMFYTRPYNRRFIRSGRLPVFYEPYDRWAGYVELAQPGIPRWFTIAPKDRLIVSPVPSKAVSLTFDYKRAAQVLSDDDDIPCMPSQYHDIILFRAMIKYAGYDEAAFQYQSANEEYRERLTQLRRDQLSEIRVG